MKKQTGILLLVGLAIVIGLIYWTSSKDSTKLGTGVFMSGPVKFKYLGQGPEGVAAKLVNKSITEKELIKRSGKLQELEKSEIKILQNKNNLNQVKLSEIKTQQFQEKIIVLRGLFVRQLLLLDAKAKKATIESLVKGHIVKGSIVVSDREIELFAKDKNITLRPNDHRLNKQLKSIITENKRNMAINNYIKKTFPDKYAEIFFRGPTKIIPINENKSI